MAFRAFCAWAVSCAGLLATAGDFGRFSEFAPGAIRPTGHLREFLVRERDGMAGNRAKMGYPYDTTLWRGRIGNPHFTEGVYRGSNMPLPQGSWWPYEQGAYYLDGALRLSQLVEAPALREEFVRNLDWVLEHADSDGRLGNAYGDFGSADVEWPMAVFFRAALAYMRETGDRRVIDAFVRHYRSRLPAAAKWKGRDVVNFEGLFEMRAFDPTLDFSRELLACLGDDWYYTHLDTTKRVFSHGVTFAETLKMPVIAYLATGERLWLDRARKGLENAVAENEQPGGQLSANEFLSGRDPRQGYETCVAADMLWTLGYFLRADGDVAAADRMERIAYNAFPGAIKKDFTGIAYLSAPNQVLATPFSNNTHFNYGESAWRQYRPDHFPQCCPGNALRAMPAFVSRMWMRDSETGAPTAMLYGPCELKGEQGGVSYLLAEETNYPFGDTVRFVLRSDRPLELAIRYRVPGWCPDPGLRSATLKSGEPLEVVFAPPVVRRDDRNWHWFERGPLCFSYAVPSAVTSEDPSDRFAPVTVAPTGPWNFALDLGRAVAGSATLVRPRFRAGAYPFETPTVKLRVPVEEIEEWRTPELGRFTPDVPVYTHPTGVSREIELVPYATTLARVTAFPDTERRKPLHVVAAYASTNWYPWAWGSLADAKYRMAEDGWTDWDFRTVGRIPQRTPDGYFDLITHFKRNSMNFAYLCFRVWSDEDCEATFMVSMSQFGTVRMDGETVLELEGFHEAETMAPQWFRHRVRRGYNYVYVKVGSHGHWPQYRDAWGVKLEAFVK